MNSKGSGRRRFLKDSAALAGLAVGAVRSVSGATPGPTQPKCAPKTPHAYGERSRFETSIRMGSMGLFDAPRGMVETSA